ncbi:hypothetical protein HQ587_09810 [bacterium]|nr:hypothetical protein [bacterium]
MLTTFVTAVDRSDDDLAYACLIDERGFDTLNPDASARSNAESFMAEYLAGLIQSYRDMKQRYKGCSLKYKKFEIGSQFYQYRGFSAFKDNKVFIEVNGAEETFMIGSIVRIGDKWLIVDIGTPEY